MKTLFKRAATACALALGLFAAAPALAQSVDCSTLTAPNTAGTTANATYEAMVKVCQALTSSALSSSGVTAVGPEALVSNTRSTHMAPIAGRPVYIRLSGTGSVTATIVYSYDGGSNYSPKAVATDGASPIIIGRVAYNGAVQNGVVLTAVDAFAGYRVAVLPGDVTGSVNVEIRH